MTLDQYLGTVAWLFMVFLMWFSVDRREQFSFDLYVLDKKINIKPIFSDLCFAYYVLCPSFFWAIVLGIWIDSTHKLLA